MAEIFVLLSQDIFSRVFSLNDGWRFSPTKRGENLHVINSLGQLKFSPVVGPLNYVFALSVDKNTHFLISLAPLVAVRLK